MASLTTIVGDYGKQISTTRLDQIVPNVTHPRFICDVYYFNTGLEFSLTPEEADDIYLNQCYTVAQCTAEPGECYQKLETDKPKRKCAGCSIVYCEIEAGLPDRRRQAEYAPKSRRHIIIGCWGWLLFIIALLALGNAEYENQLLLQRLEPKTPYLEKSK